MHWIINDNGRLGAINIVPDKLHACRYSTKFDTHMSGKFSVLLSIWMPLLIQVIACALFSVELPKPMSAYFQLDLQEKVHDDVI